MLFLIPFMRIAVALLTLVAAAGCYDYAYSPGPAERTDEAASPVSNRVDGDWQLFPDGSSIAAVQRFYHDKFEAKVPTPSGSAEGACEAGMACQLWLNDVPSGNQWTQVTASANKSPAMYDLVVFAPTDSIKSFVGVVDHVEKGTIYVMSSDAHGDLRRAALPHGWRGKAYGWFHLKKIEKSPNDETPVIVDAGPAPAPAPAPTTPDPSCTPNAYYCGGHKLDGQANQLYRCQGNDAPPKLMARCANGCKQNADGVDDECNAPTPCISGGDYCGGDKVNGDPDVLYNCDTPTTTSVITRCAKGCTVMPQGNDDKCNP